MKRGVLKERVVFRDDKIRRNILNGSESLTTQVNLPGGHKTTK